MAIRKVGDCRLLGPLGKGGMAQVYRAIHEPLQREVAVKELTPEAAKNAESLSRFKREAMALAGFRHQHIVTLYDLIEKNDGWYMVMELVDGPTLGELIKEAPLPPEAVAVLGLQLSSALEHAHFHRVVHRDIKPGNIMLSTWGDAKLMDFGIVQTEELDRLTKTGMAVGTPAYMSPEQVTGAQVDARSDLYSLGVVLYEALAGTRPFTGANPGEVFAKVTTGRKTPLKKAAPKAPAALRDVIEKAMALEVEDRFPDATALRRAFEQLLSGLDSSPSAVLVNFLRKRNRITESEAMARLSQTQLTQLSQLSPAELAAVRRPRWGLSILLGLALGGAVATREWWWPFLAQWLAKLGAPLG
ncbi:MAG: serine/threonine-protein kinase [Myxococcota bacterium]|jgi:serine/threonine-protein kinase